MADYLQEQEMEIEALQAILMEEFEEINSYESGLNTSNRCFKITIVPQDYDIDNAANSSAQLALIFSHTEKYPDEPPLLNLKSLRGIQSGHISKLKEKLIQEASESLGMAMMYGLVTSAKEWLSETYGEVDEEQKLEEEAASKDDIITPHGEAVTVDTFLAWRERFEAEIALERAKLIPEAALAIPKEKKLTGRQWFESGRAKGAVPVNEGSDEEDEEEMAFDEDDFEDDDEEDMLEHFLAENSNIKC